MFEFDVTKWVPRFILQDKNGYAIAKAIEAGIQIMNDTIEAGVKCIADYDTMPEWRLDELAWETNCLYDYNADIAVKREWIKSAIPLYRLYGTPDAIYKYIGSYFDDVDVEENWIYNGKPYHFRVTVEGDWTPEKETWAKKAIDTSKNVRSVLDSLRIGCRCDLAIMAEGEVLARFYYPLTSAQNWAGRWPQEAYQGILDESLNTVFSGEARGQAFQYPAAGTRPQINTIGVLDQNTEIGLLGNADAYQFDYVMGGNAITGTVPQERFQGILDESASTVIAGEDGHQTFKYPVSGTNPEINMIGITDQSAEVGIQGSAEEYPFDYAMSGDVAAGTVPQINTIGVSEKENIQAESVEDSYTKITYRLCGQDEI